MNINIDQNLAGFLDREAQKDNVTKEVWVERKINALLLSLWKASIGDSIRVQKVEDIVAIDAVVAPLIDGIKTRDFQPFVPGVVKPEII